MWILFSLIASVFWGLTYVLNEQIFKKITVFTFLTLTSFGVFLISFFISFFSNSLSRDLRTISSSREITTLIIFSTITLVVAEFFIGTSISTKNATLSGLIEISYPIFIAFFSFLFYKQNSVGISVVLGGVLIFIGIIIIYSFNH
jgi:drug/metabolite transporter (DMT)-like permease